MASASVFSTEERCNFELKFDELDGDGGLTPPVSNLFAPAEPLRHFDDHSTEEERRTHSRKRKMDKEGFVTPATPDIPKSSLQYGISEHSNFGEPEAGGNRSRVEREDPEDGFMATQQQEQQQQRDITEASDVSMSSSPTPNKRYESAADLFEGEAQGTKMLIIQMAQNFRESEEFESLCLANVESLLAEAKALEASLHHQKELLQQRLFMIGRRLNSNSE